MQNEKIAAIVLVLIIVGALVVYLGATYWSDIFKNLFGEEKTIEPGDCADVHYIGTFAATGTVFNTTYADIATKSGGTPAKIFVNPNMNLTPPVDYEEYSSVFIFIPPKIFDGLVGMKEGGTKNITLTPEDAYGDWNESMVEIMHGSKYLPRYYQAQNTTQAINKSDFQAYFPEVNLTLNTTFDYFELTMGIKNILNATITNITNENVTIKLSPINGTTYFNDLFNWSETILVENASMFSVRIDPTINATFGWGDPSYYITHYKILDFNETDIKLTMNVGAPTVDFVGQTLVFEVKVVHIYKTSEK